MQRKVSVIGLGYVGLPVAVALGKKGYQVTAFDISTKRIDELKQGFDRTKEVTKTELLAANLFLTAEASDLARADFHIITVPTPIDHVKRPDLTPLESASHTLGQYLKSGDIVVYESTVYPGATEEVCVPILEKTSNLQYGRDFFVGYSPERINPGDQQHRFETITKVVSGCDEATLEIVARVYSDVVTAGVHKAPNIKTAEAAKVIENTQRDLNIALMNELSLIFQRLGIDTYDVLEAAKTKWNFLPFTPGLVGGHCISVDPYYLTHKAQSLGYHPEIILAGRRINDDMGAHVAREAIRLCLAQRFHRPLKMAVLGATFKENVPDCRNSRVVDIIHELYHHGVEIHLHDPHADDQLISMHDLECEIETINFTSLNNISSVDAVIISVAHEAYTKGGWHLIQQLLGNIGAVVLDLRGCLDRTQTPEHITLWRL